MWRVFIFNLTIALFFLGLFMVPKAMGTLFLMVFIFGGIIDLVAAIKEKR